MALETGEVTKQQKIVLAILGIVGLIVLYNKVYAPMSGKIKEAQTKLVEQEKKLREMKIKAGKLDILEKEFNMLEKLLKKTEEKLPKSKELPKFIKTITDAAAKYRMDVKTLKISGKSSSQYYEQHPYGLNLNSNYHTFGVFFTEIAQLDRIFNIKNLKLSPSVNKDGKDELSADFQLIAYTFKE